MIKNIIYLLIFLRLILIPIKVFANGQFLKDDNNPIEIISEVVSWNEISQRQPSILYESNIFKIWYSSYNGVQFKIVYSESKDLKTIYTKKLININYDQSYDFHDPSIIKVDNKYELYFAISKNGSNYKILKTVSNDGINFENTPLEILNTNLPWNTHAVSSPFVFYENNNYYLFYTGWNGSEWKLGLSISINGTDWINCANNPIIPFASGPTLIKQQDKYLLYFHSSNASNIESVETNDSLSCASNWTNRQLILTRDKTYDDKLITDPNIIDLNDDIYLIYSGLNNANKWSFNLASLYSYVKNKYVIFIPGFMTSWNKNALIYNLTSSIYDWKILDFIKEYDGLKASLANTKYKLEENFFIFAYDWRKSLEDLSENLKDFIYEKILSKNVQSDIYIIGHSFGGLVGRIYTQKYPEIVKKIITVGTPHKGTAKVYKAIQAGNVDSTNDYLSLAQNLILNLNRDLYKSDKEIVLNLFPSLIDLYPIYNFLYDNNEKELDINNQIIKNSSLLKYKDTTIITNKLTSLYSRSYTALLGYKIKNPSLLNKLLGNYIDGEPLESKYAPGDKNITEESTKIGENTLEISGDHEEIIYKSDSIKKILDLLDITYTNEDIVEGMKTVINPSLIFVIKSPAIMEVRFDDKFYYEKDGLIFIPNASSGNYKLKIQGTSYGKYTVLVGQISQNNEIWEELNGEITSIIPSDHIDIFEFEFNNQLAESIKKNSTPDNPLTINAADKTTLSNTSISEFSNSNSKSNNKSDTINDDSSYVEAYNPDLQTKEVLGISTETKNKQNASNNLNKLTNDKKSKNKNWTTTLAEISLLILGIIIYFLSSKLFKEQ